MAFQRKRPAAIGTEANFPGLAEIEYRAKSAEGKVRHPVFKGIREDKRWLFTSDGFFRGAR